MTIVSRTTLTEAPARRLGTMDRLALVGLLLQATDFYKVLGYFATVPSHRVNLAFIGAYVIYLLDNQLEFGRLLNTTIGQLWALTYVAADVIMGLQMVAGTISLGRFIYWLASTSVYAGGFAVAAVLFYKAGERLVMPFFMTLLAGLWVGFLANIYDYALIQHLLAYTGSDLGRYDTSGRIIGFAGQPNMAAFSVVMTLAALVSNSRFLRSPLWVHAMVLAAAVAGVAVTGSRTSTLLVVFIVAWYFVSMHRLPGPSRIVVSRALVAPVLLVAVALAGAVGVSSLLGKESSIYTTMTHRLQTLPQMFGGDNGGVEDQSIVERKQVLGAYVAGIEQRPIRAWGPDYASKEIQAGQISNVSQNSWLEWGLEYGLVYVLVVVLALWVTMRKAYLRRRVDREGWARVGLVLLIFLGASFSLVELLSLRAPVVTLGMTVGLLVRSAEKNGAPSLGG